MNKNKKRFAINVGGTFVPGMNAVIMGAVLAADRLGWEIVGIKDGFNGILYPDIYPDDGMITLNPELVENMDPSASSILGQSPQVDPFHIRKVNEDGIVEEVDLSDKIIETLHSEGIDGLISVVSGRGLSILYKLHRKGLNVICIPRSIENDIAGTMVSFGFNTALSFTIEMLSRVRQAAQSARRIGVVEVLGSKSGWLALQAGIAVCADAVLIPEIPCDLDAVASMLEDKVTPRREFGLVVVTDGIRFADTGKPKEDNPTANSLKDSLSPFATGGSSGHIIQRTGQAAEIVAKRLQLLTAIDTYPLTLGPWARGGHPTAIDRQLGLAYGAGAIQALKSGQNGAMVAFQPPNIEFVPLIKAINKIRTVPADSEFMQTAKSLGIFLGREL